MQEDPSRLSPTIPGNFSTIRATAASCEVDGGGFVLSFGELRPIREHKHFDKFSPEKSAFIEVSRVALSPVTFLFLLQTLAQAQESYEHIFGALPDLEVVRKRVKAMIPDEIERTVVEQRIGFRSAT